MNLEDVYTYRTSQNLELDITAYLPTSSSTNENNRTAAWLFNGYINQMMIYSKKLDKQVANNTLTKITLMVSR